MPAPHHSVFYRPDALPAAQPTVSEHFCSAFCSAFEKIIKTYLFTVTGALDVLSDTEWIGRSVIDTWWLVLLLTFCNFIFLFLRYNSLFVLTELVSTVIWSKNAVLLYSFPLRTILTVLYAAALINYNSCCLFQLTPCTFCALIYHKSQWLLWCLVVHCHSLTAACRCHCCLIDYWHL